MDNLIKLIGDQVGPDAMSSLVGLTGETEQATGSAVNAAIPALIGLMSKQGASSAGAGQLVDLMNNQSGDMDITGNFAGLLGNESSRNQLSNAGGGILSSLLGGGSTSGLFDLITRTAGLKSGSSSMLMSLLAPFVIGMVKKKLLGSGGGGLNAGSLMSLLGGQSKFLESSAPAGLAGLLGMNSFADLGETSTSATSSMASGVSDRVESTVDRVEQKADRVSERVGDSVESTTAKASGGLPKWLLPLAAILALGFILYSCLGGRSASVDVPSVDTPNISMPAAVCDNMSGLSDAIGGLPESVDADTETSGLTGIISTVSGIVAKIADAGVPVPGLDALQSAITTIEGLLGGAGDTLGDAAGEVGEAVGGLRTAGEGLVSGAGCN